MSDAQPTVLIENDGAIRTLRLNRPDVLNAFNDDLLIALSKEAKAAARDESVRCVIITGAGRAFCSGQDLDTVKERMNDPNAPELGQHLREHYNPLIVTLHTMAKPVIAAVNGVAAGAGCSLALACDLRVAAASASFIEAFIKVGLVPDSGSTFTLPRLVGMSRAMEIACTGRKVGAEEALQIGLVNKVVPDDELSAATMQWAGELSSLPTRAIALTKQAFNRSWTADLEGQLEYEALQQTTAGKTEDHHEGVRAFLEKRKPRFKGR